MTIWGLAKPGSCIGRAATGSGSWPSGSPWPCPSQRCGLCRARARSETLPLAPGTGSDPVVRPRWRLGPTGTWWKPCCGFWISPSRSASTTVPRITAAVTPSSSRYGCSKRASVSGRPFEELPRDHLGVRIPDRRRRALRTRGVWTNSWAAPRVVSRTPEARFAHPTDSHLGGHVRPCPLLSITDAGCYRFLVTPPNEMPLVMTIPMVARICHVNEKTIRRWIDSGVLRAVKHQRFVRVLRADFADALQRMRVDPYAPPERGAIRPTRPPKSIR